MRFFFIAMLCSLSLSAQTLDEVKNFTKAGIQAYNLKKMKQARQLFSSALNLDSTWGPAVLNHGRAYADYLLAELHIKNTEKLIGFENFVKAETELDEAETIFPEHPQIPVLRELIRKKRADNTKTLLEKMPPKKRKAYEEAIQKATIAMQKANYTEAIHHFSSALKIAPDSVDAQMGYAEAERLMKGIQSDQNVARLMRQAQKFEKERRFAQAVSTYDQVLRSEPQNTQAVERRAALLDFMQQQLNKNERKLLAKEYLQSGNDAFKKSDYNTALEHYRIGQALDARFTDWDTLIKKALEAKKKQDDNLFVDRLKELERRYQSAMVQLLLDNYPAAIEDLEVVIQIAKEFKQTETEAQAQALLDKAKQAMLRQDDEFISRDSPYFSFVESLTSMGLNSYKARDCEKTMKHFGAIVEVFPRNRISNQHILSCTIILHPEKKNGIIQDLVDSIYRFKDSNAFEAKRLFEILKFIDPTNPIIAQLEKDLTEKTALVKKAVKPAEYIEALYRKALLLSQGEPQAAIKVLRELLEDDPRHTRARILLARIEARLSRERWAQSDIPIAPAALQAYADGIVFYNTGSIGEAKAAFSKAIELAPNFERAHVALKKCESYSKGMRL